MTRNPRARRGANAIEFAMLLPVLVAMFAGMTDYGWYFWREAMLVNGLREAVRAGGLKLPDSAEGAGVCAQCVAAAQVAAASTLSSQGYSGVTITPTIERVPTTGTPCTYAVVIDATIPHSRIFPLVPGPTSMDVRLVSMAQNLVCN